MAHPVLLPEFAEALWVLDEFPDDECDRMPGGLVASQEHHHGVGDDACFVHRALARLKEDQNEINRGNARSMLS